MIEKFPELLEHPGYKAATTAAAKAVKGRDAAQAKRDQLAAGIPDSPSPTERAKAWLTGGAVAVKAATVSREELEAADADLEMMAEAVRLAGEAADAERKSAVRAAMEARLPTHKALVGEVCDALDAAVASIDACAEFVGDCTRMTNGGAISPIHLNTPAVAFTAQLRHQAKEFRANVAHYIEGGK